MKQLEKYKLFVGGLSKETNNEKLREHFSNYGTVVESEVAMDNATDSSLGYGYIIFSHPHFLDAALGHRHTIDQKNVNVHRFRKQNHGEGSSGGTDRKSSWITRDDKFRNKKILFGGISDSVSENEIKSYFERFGSVVHVQLIYCRFNKRSQGYGFITFESEEAVNRVLQKKFHEIRAGSRFAEVKRLKDRYGCKNSGVVESSGTSSNPDSGHHHQLGQNPVPNTYASGPSHHQQGDYGAPNAYVSGPSHHQPAGYYRTPNPYASNLGLHQPAVYYGTPNPYASNPGPHQLAHYPASNPYVSGLGHHRPEHYGPSNPFVSGPSDHQPEHIGAPNPYVSSPSNHQPAYYSTPDYFYGPYPYYAPPRPYGYGFPQGTGYYLPRYYNDSGVPNMELYEHSSEFANGGGQEDDTNLTSVQTAGREGDADSENE